MNINFDNNDFILGLIASKVKPSAWTERIASGYFDHHRHGRMDYYWYLMSYTDLNEHALALTNGYDVVEWKSRLPGLTKIDVTNGIIAPFNAGIFGGLPCLACLLTHRDVFLNKRWVSKPPVVRAIKEGRKGLPDPFKVKEWSKRVGLE